MLTLAFGLALVAALAVGGYALLQARAEGIPSRQALAPVPSASPSGRADNGVASAPHWIVGKAVRPFAVRRSPRNDARPLVRLGRVNPNGYPTLVLVDTTRDVDGVSWSRVWVAMRPNGSRGWVREGDLSFYTTTAKIEISLSQRLLRVYRRGEVRGSFRVAVGRRGLETPTGFFFVNQKLRPASPDGPYGVLAIGISAFQPSLSHWPQGGPVAIHGTNQEELIGQAISHGCVRMRNRDVLQVSRLVPAGSPVVIRK